VAERAVRALAFDVAVIGVSGLDARAGLTSASALNAGPLALMAEGAHAVLVVADHTKFTNVCLAPIGALELVDVLVTDAEPPPELRAALAAARVDVVLAEGPTSS
jgi:DeoR/GlpR family transcriptional regulator of sugar metabolism